MSKLTERLLKFTSNLIKNDEQVTYDNMGNITQLIRAGNAPASYIGTLAYSYNNQSNQLAHVNLNGSSAALKSFTYDGNGNATTTDTGKTLTYNLLNLPQTVKNSGGTTMATYYYSAAGDKLRNVSALGGTWDYIDGIVYQGGHIMFIRTEEGRATLLSSDSTTYAYNTEIKDYLGNVRATIDNGGTGGAARLLQENDYFPFGLTTKYYDLSNGNRYLYNGKELQTDLTDQYDYGARFYDPVIGRWTVVDPDAEDDGVTSPYNYVGNNPISNVDLDGRTMYVDPNGRTIVNTNDGRNGIYVVSWDLYKSFANAVNNLGGFNGERNSDLDSKQWNDFWRNSTSMLVSDYAMDHYAIGFKNLSDDLKQTWVHDRIAGTSDFEGAYIKSQWKDPVVVVGSLLAFAHAGVGMLESPPVEPTPVKSAPKPSPNFVTPTNAPQPPPETVPPGYTLRVMKPTQQYPNGYWVLEKQMPQGGFQKVNPTTMKPGPNYETHVPLPAKK